MKWFVYYSYDYEFDGFEEFDTEAAALVFIEEHLAQHPAATLEDFSLVEGTERQLIAREQVTKIAVA